MILQRTDAWAKRPRDSDGSWHSLLAHSIDVAAVFDAIIELPIFRARMEHACGRPLTEADRQRLCYLAFIHDIGKASSGFRFKVEDGSKVGHIKEIVWLLRDAPASLSARPLSLLFTQLFESAGAAADELDQLVMATFAHHGSITQHKETGGFRSAWAPRSGYDPINIMEAISDAGRQMYPLAFSQPSDVISPRLTHLFAGLLQLADWIGSDRRLFEFSNGEQDHGRQEWAISSAIRALGTFGLDNAQYRLSRSQRRPSVETSLGVPRLRPAQRETMLAEGQLVILEGETGSGKTEAALARFLDLFDKGLVESLYFALPTRVAATEIYHRVRATVDRAFPKASRPSVLLAVPGQVDIDGLKGLPQPDFTFSWEDGQQHPEFWAAEHSKRFLAASIAVGTIDQILLGGLRVKHAHMRSAAASRSLVVIDEVHASDTYMAEVLDAWLENHLSAGGYALLLSATLGSVRRAQLLSQAPQSLGEAAAVPYPLLSTQSSEISIASEGRPKAVEFQVMHALYDFDAVARLAVEAAAEGAKVLIIKNTVASASSVFQSVLKHEQGRELIWKVRGRPALHHSRFGTGDRALLDSEVQAAIGKNAPAGGVIVIGTQTLEQSLDLDADLLITDLCPMDVLLQRIGRLHRHRDRVRVSGFEEAKVIVLAPTATEFEDLAEKPGHGLGVGSWGGVYPDLFVAMCTLGAIRRTPVVEIPRDNRLLVESSTHPEAVNAMADPFLGEQRWMAHYNLVRGKVTAAGREGRKNSLCHDLPFEKVVFAGDERIAARLGAMDRIVPVPGTIGPFGVPIGSVKIPGYMSTQIGDRPVLQVLESQKRPLEIRIDGSTFLYDESGLRIKSKD